MAPPHCRRYTQNTVTANSDLANVVHFVSFEGQFRRVRKNKLVAFLRPTLIEPPVWSVWLSTAFILRTAGTDISI